MKKNIKHERRHPGGNTKRYGEGSSFRQRGPSMRINVPRDFGPLY
jgi:hypothetical protein